MLRAFFQWLFHIKSNDVFPQQSYDGRLTAKNRCAKAYEFLQQPSEFLIPCILKNWVFHKISNSFSCLHAWLPSFVGSVKSEIRPDVNDLKKTLSSDSDEM